jgi:uncharacterized protein (TIGR02284 family)
MTMRTTHTAVQLSEQQCEELNALIHLDFDAIEAYEAAISRLDDKLAKTRLTQFMGDHERHIRELSAVVRASGYEPPVKGDAMRFLTKGKVVLGNLVGDKGILAAMRANEEVTNERYDAALNNELLANHRALHELLTRNRNDERQHKAWLDSRV